MDNFKLTDKGRVLLSKVVDTPLTLTSMSLGKGTLTVFNPSLTSLVSEVMKQEIERCYHEDDGIYIQTIFTNENLETGFYVNEIGVFALDPDDGEILYAYANTYGEQTDFFKPGLHNVILKEIIEAKIVFGNASGVLITADPSKIYATVEELNGVKTIAEQAFTQASNGKEAIKAAITGIDPTVTIPTDATFQQLAEAIGQIETGEDTSDATATAEYILAELTAYVKGVKVTGTMANNGPVGAETVNLASQGEEYSIAKGFHSGLRKIKATITGLISGNIKAGAIVGGIEGNFTSDATAGAGSILEGRIAYTNGNKVTGTIPIVNPDYADQALATNITVGTHTADGNRYAYMNHNLSGKYSNGINWVRSLQPDLIPTNILAPATIFGVQGTAIAGKRFATGQFINVQGYTNWTRISDGGTWLDQGYYRVSSLGLAFTPRIILYYMATTPTTNLYVCMYFRDGFTYQGRTGYCCAATFVFGCQNEPSNDYLYVGNNGTWNYVAWE